MCVKAFFGLPSSAVSRADSFFTVSLVIYIYTFVRLVFPLQRDAAELRLSGSYTVWVDFVSSPSDLYVFSPAPHYPKHTFFAFFVCCLPSVSRPQQHCARTLIRLTLLRVTLAITYGSTDRSVAGTFSQKFEIRTYTVVKFVSPSNDTRIYIYIYNMENVRKSNQRVYVIQS